MDFFLLMSKRLLNSKWWQSENAIKWTNVIGVEQIGNLALKIPQSTLIDLYFDLWLWWIMQEKCPSPPCTQDF